MKRVLLWATIAVGLFSSHIQASDWPQWRGLHRDGLSDEKGLLQEWPPEGPKLIWKVSDVGSGYSTPSVVGDRLFLMSNEGMDNEFVQALSATDGKKVWSTRAGKAGPNRGPQYPGARSTPTVDGDMLYALGSDGDLVCLEKNSGKTRWQKNLRQDFKGKPGNWAYAESPLVDGEMLVCSPGGAESTIIALNKKNGDVIWKSPIPGGDDAAYASIIIIQAGGIKQYVQFLQKGLVGIEANTGKSLWRYDKTAVGSAANIPTPVADGDYIFSGAGRTGGGLIRLKSSQGAFEPEQINFTPKLPTSIGGALKVGNYLYGTTSALLCAEFLTGTLKWEDRGIGAASLCYADNRLYLHGENGEVALVEATPAGYHEKGRFTPPDQPNRGQSKAWAYPVVANGRLYIRDLGALWSYDVKIQQNAGN